MEREAALIIGAAILNVTRYTQSLDNPSSVVFIAADKSVHVDEIGALAANMDLLDCAWKHRAKRKNSAKLLKAYRVDE